MFKKIFAVTAAALMCLTLCACAQNSKTSADISGLPGVGGESGADSGASGGAGGSAGNETYAPDGADSYNPDNSGGAEDVKYFSYRIENGEVIITGYSGNAENVVIPSKIEGCPVKIIEHLYLTDETKSVVIPDGVTVIGTGAFSSCGQLKSVTLPDTLTEIGESGFIDCKSLSGIRLPESLTTLGKAAFAYCESLTEIAIPKGVTEIPELLFHNCSGLTVLTLPPTLKNIGDVAFADCGNLKELELPEGLEKIGDLIVSGCTGIDKIKAPATLQSVGKDAFYTGNDSITVLYDGKTYTQKDFERLYIAIRKPSDSLEGVYKVLEEPYPWFCSVELIMTKREDGRYQAHFSYGDIYALFESESAIGRQTDVNDFTGGGGIIGTILFKKSGTTLNAEFRYGAYVGSTQDFPESNVEHYVFEKTADLNY